MNHTENGVFPVLQLRVLCGVLTSSQVSRRSQVGKVIQADDINDGADHSRVILHWRRTKMINIINCEMPYLTTEAQLPKCLFVLQFNTLRKEQDSLKQKLA